jgi:hypothetical protein
MGFRLRAKATAWQARIDANIFAASSDDRLQKELKRLLFISACLPSANVRTSFSFFGTS